MSAEFKAKFVPALLASLASTILGGLLLTYVNTKVQAARFEDHERRITKTEDHIGKHEDEKNRIVRSYDQDISTLKADKKALQDQLNMLVDEIRLMRREFGDKLDAIARKP